MIFHSRLHERSSEVRGSGQSSRKGAGVVAGLGKWVAALPVFLLVFFVYVIVNAFNPDSRWCNYKIYKQPDGTYQVWWSCRTRHIEGTFATYAEAKAFQVQECRALLKFMAQKPTGELTK